MKFVVGENGRNTAKNLPRPRFVHHETHMEWPRRELGTPAVGGEHLTACTMRPPLQINTRAIFFQGLIGCDIKTTVKIRNVLFATFSYTYQLLLYIVATLTTFFVARYQLSNTLVTEAAACALRQFSVMVCSSLSVPKCCPPRHHFMRKEMKIRGNQVRIVWWVIKHFPSNNAAGASLLQLQCEAKHCHEGQYLMTIFLVICSE